MKRLFIIVALLLFGCTTNTYNYNKKNTVDHIGLAYNSVVRLAVESSSGYVVATGFSYDKDRIITAGHFCVSAIEIQMFDTHVENIEMVFYNYNVDNGSYASKSVGGLKIESVSNVEDLCILRKNNHGLRPLKIADDYSKVKVRDKIVVVGVPSGFTLGEFYGRVMSTSFEKSSRLVRGKLMLSVDATGGISGSPVMLEETGEVIGVLVVSYGGFPMSFAVRGDHLKTFVEGLE